MYFKLCKLASFSSSESEFEEFEELHTSEVVEECCNSGIGTAT